MSNTNNNLVIFQPQNIQQIVQLGPSSFNENTLSHTRCLQAGNQLLQRLQTEGMSDTLDQEIARYIERSRITVKKMNSKRSPVTKLFDMIRAEYTAIENDIDPSKAGSLPYQLQQQRNAYAAKKIAEAEAAHRAEMLRRQQEAALAAYRTDVENEFKRRFNQLVDESIARLGQLDENLTLENYTQTLAALRDFTVNYPQDWGQHLQSFTTAPAGMSNDECLRIQANILSELIPWFSEQFTFDVAAARDEILDRLPSKRAELERIAKASADETARIKAQMEERERAEAQRKEQERAARDQQEQAAAALAAQRQEMEGLFTYTPQAQYIPKTNVKKKIVIHNHDDIMAVFGLWWAREGGNLSVEELQKMFRKQITFCEKLANDKNQPVTITGIDYQDDVKAK